jgi:hypothetical protein
LTDHAVKYTRDIVFTRTKRRQEKLDISSLVTASSATPSSCCSLVRLDLGVNKLDDDDMIQLAGALPNNKPLKELDVRCNHITNRDTEILARESLVTMGLRNCNHNIDKEGAVAMRDTPKVRVIVILEYVGLSQDFTCWYELEIYTALNWGGRVNSDIVLWSLVLELASEQVRYDGLSRQHFVSPTTRWTCIIISMKK